MTDAQTVKASGVTWDLTSYFPEFNGSEVQGFTATLKEDIAKLQGRVAALEPLGENNQDAWEELCLLAENLSARLGHVFSYVGCLSAADAANEAYAAEEQKLTLIAAEFEKFMVGVQAGFKEASDGLFEAFVNREKLLGMGHSLGRIREKAQKTMSQDMEMLAADLGVDGFHAWGQLYDTLTGKLEFKMVDDKGNTQSIPISQWRSMMSDVDRTKGRRAFDAGNVAWRTVEDTCAAALNSIAGTRLALNKHRGIDHFLETALFQSQITQDSLDAMYKAIYDNIDIARDIFNAKAEFLGQKGIAWHEKEAPLPLGESKTYSWEEGRDMVGQAFATAYPDLAAYYSEFLEKRWVESEVRPGKRPGAFCTGSEHTGEQRVYMTFNGALGDVTTLAHEMGHAWHSHVLKDLRPAAQEYPMTLAETASIFAENILAEGIYDDDAISDDEKLKMLDADLSGAAILLLDITTRFEFEKKFYEERQNGPLSVSRLKELMVETQKKVWGDSLAEGGEDEMFWASKLHFYITYVSFYNFPYTFGFLLARTLAALFKENGQEWLPKYSEFLRLTGSHKVEEVVSKALGEDTTNPEFWAKAIRDLAAPLAQYKELLAARK